MVRIIKPPSPLDIELKPALFLAGSIEMGLANNWQTVMEQELAALPITILNPRRDSWDSSWVQSIDNGLFREQVEWELEAQERADIIAMYFDAQTKAPITLLELGLFARTNKLIVCCPQGFWRKGNVDIVCHKYGIETTDSLASLISRVKERLG